METEKDGLANIFAIIAVSLTLLIFIGLGEVIELIKGLLL